MPSVSACSLCRFRLAAEAWELHRDGQLQAGATADPLLLRRLNDQAMLLERVFLIPGGLPGRPAYRHAFFSPSKHNSYGECNHADPALSVLQPQSQKDCVWCDGVILTRDFLLAAGAAFPGLADLLYDEAELDRKEREERWRQIRKHLSDLMIIFRQATRWLNTDEMTSAFPL